MMMDFIIHMVLMLVLGCAQGIIWPCRGDMEGDSACSHPTAGVQKYRSRVRKSFLTSILCMFYQDMAVVTVLRMKQIEPRHLRSAFKMQNLDYKFGALCAQGQLYGMTAKGNIDYGLLEQ